MPHIAVDSNVLIGYRLARDQYHDRATSIVRGIDTGDLPTGIVTDFCVAETLNIIGERAGHEAGVSLLDALIESRGFELVRTTRAEFSTEQSIYRRHEPLTFVDAITVATMRRRNVGFVYSFDTDFDAVPGITRLDSDDDPYA